MTWKERMWKLLLSDKVYPKFLLLMRIGQKYSYVDEDGDREWYCYVCDAQGGICPYHTRRELVRCTRAWGQLKSVQCTLRRWRYQFRRFCMGKKERERRDLDQLEREANEMPF